MSIAFNGVLNMDYKNTLLGLTSLLALTAGTQYSADASIQRPDNVAQTVQARSGGSVQSQALFDDLIQTKGGLTSDTMEHAIADMFSNPSREQIQNAPELLRDFAGLGLGAEAIQRLRNVLSDIVSSAENLDDELRASVVAQLNSQITPFVLAQARRGACTPAQLRNPRLRAECDPEVGQTQQRRDPDEVGPGGGGYQ